MAMMAALFLVSLDVFFSVGFFIYIPIGFSAGQEAEGAGAA
jgi:H+/gluconate symporter-like permease